MSTQPAVYAFLPSQDDQRQPIFSVLVKRTYDIQADKVLVRAKMDRAFVEADEYYADPKTSSLKLETELVPYKVATDVVFIGKAYTSEAVIDCLATLTVGEHSKTMYIVGDRVCTYLPRQLPFISEPKPFTEMELTYERAYGGRDKTQSEEITYPRNHAGVGFVLHNTPEAIEDLILPNIEDPQDKLTPERLIVGDMHHWWQQPLPQGLSYYAKSWYPRCSYIGVLPAYVPLGSVMPEAKLGLVPKNQVELARSFKLPSLDPRFFNGASLGLALPYLQGHEAIHLQHLSPEGELKFYLPQEQPLINLDIGEGAQELTALLQTVLIRESERQVDLVWQGSLAYPGIHWLPKMKQCHIYIE
ncbi:MAG: DUF2169 domain-containing protein [Pseudomonadota bacterium]|nr:DUF2169 domain-containing protein [Pseudomonadota bacterium]